MYKFLSDNDEILEFEDLDSALDSVIVDRLKDNDYASVASLATMMNTGEFASMSEEDQRNLITEYYQEYESEEFIIKKEADITGTYKIGSLLNLYFRDLKKIFGNPTNMNSGDGKVRYEWDLTINNKIITIYDWKTEGLSRDEIDIWSIGGRNKEDIEVLEKFLSQRLEKSEYNLIRI